MNGLNMVRIEMDRNAFYRWAATTGLPLDDQGYLLHFIMAQAYGDLYPRPFQYSEQDQTITVLGYTGSTDQTLKEVRQATAEPLLNLVFKGETSKLMPEKWKLNQPWKFSIQVIPTRRGIRAGKKVETDAVFFAQGQTREAVYKQWLNERIIKASSLQGVRLQAFNIQKVSRKIKAKNRIFSNFCVPVARLEGVLKITNTDEFSCLLGSGIGRQSAFGFGMLLLKPLGVQVT